MTKELEFELHMLSLNNGNDSPYTSHKSAGKPSLCHKPSYQIPSSLITNKT